MNIKLVYRESNFNLDVMEDTPCQYLYRVAQKVFRKKQSDIILFYGKIKIENDSRLLFDVMGKEDPEDILEEEIITVKLIKDIYNDYGNESKYRLKSLKRKDARTNSNTSEKLPMLIKSAFSPDSKNKNKSKKLPIKCQICSHKNSIFYCRECNVFVCFECNIRYTEHHRHKRINLEDGDTKLGVQTYKEKILGELKLIDSGYKKFSKWVISNIDRDNFLQATFRLLEKIKRNSQRLSDINTLYNIDQEMINSLKVDIEQTRIPFGQEELIDIFSSLNSKDKEIENYIKCVDLQIIKTEYNKVLVNCISNAQKHFKKIIEDVESKLHECEDMKFWGLTEVKLYLKDKKKEKINFDIFNNEETKKIENNKNGFSDSSDHSSDNDKEELKKFKMNLNFNSEPVQMSPNVSERKKSNENPNDNNIDSKRRKSVIKLIRTSDNTSNHKNINNRAKSPKKRKSMIDINENNDEKNIISNNKVDEVGYSSTINTKSRNKVYPHMKISNTLKNEDFLSDKKNDNDLISHKKGNNFVKSLMASFSGDKGQKFYRPDKMGFNNDYPLILTNRNNRNDNNSGNNDKYVPLNFQRFKESGKYGKKLNNALRQKSTKKD